MRPGLIFGLVLLPCAAWAHSTLSTPTAAAFLAGVIDPILNPAHLLAMVFIGLFAAVSGGSALWAYPVSSLGAAALGGLVGYIQPIAQPTVVVLVFVLVIVLLLLVARSPLVGICSVIALWGAAHGYFHGIELAASGDPLFGVGVLLTLGILQGAGLVLGFALGPQRPIVTGIVAALTCVLGFFVIVG